MKTTKLIWRALRTFRFAPVVGLALAALSVLLVQCQLNEPTDNSSSAKSDTTSNTLVCLVDTLGRFQSYVNGIWGSRSTSVFAAGYFNLPGNGYPLAHWDGSSWSYLYPALLAGRFGLESGDFTDVFGLNDQSIWAIGTGTTTVGTGNKDTLYGIVIWYNGSQWFNLKINAPMEPLISVWASSETDVWVGGGLGTIFHYDGITWTKIESGTEYSIVDIWGATSSEIVVAATDYNSNGFARLFNGGSWEELSPASPISAFTIWGSSPHSLFLGSIRGTESNIGGRWETIAALSSIIPARIRGNAMNDVWICSHRGELAHYNGNRWCLFPSSSSTQTVSFNDIIAFSDCVFAAGEGGRGFDSRGIIVRGRR